MGDHIPFIIIEIQSGDQPIELKKTLVVVFKKCSMLTFVKIRYETAISSAKFRNYSMKISYPLKSSMTTFDMFRKTCNLETLQCWKVIRHRM